jgi:hypothetical protein
MGMDEIQLRSTVEAMTGRIVRALSTPSPSPGDLVAAVDIETILADAEPESRTVMAELLTTLSYGAGLVADPIEVDRPDGISSTASLYATDMLHDAVRYGRARLRHGWPQVVVNGTSLPASEARLVFYMMAKAYTRTIELCGGVEWVEDVAGFVQALLGPPSQPLQGLDRAEFEETARLVIAASGSDPELAERILGRLCKRPDADRVIGGIYTLTIGAAAAVLVGDGVGVESRDERLDRDNLGFGLSDAVLMGKSTVNIVGGRIAKLSRGEVIDSQLPLNILFGSLFEVALGALYAARVAALNLPPARASTSR